MNYQRGIILRSLEHRRNMTLTKTDPGEQRYQQVGLNKREAGSCLKDAVKARPPLALPDAKLAGAQRWVL